jgi:pimeloyl-ACP methyl ester carboxylesterase
MCFGMAKIKSNFIYIHGLPGSAEEFSAFHDDEVWHLKPFGSKEFAEHYDRKKQYTIIGFSLGCMTAIEIVGRYSKNIDQLILISPAAPLELGDFLNDMDGRFVFKAAKTSSTLFWLLTFGQNLLAQFAPNFLINKMFGESCMAELELLKNSKFISAFQNGLRQSMGRERRDYRKTIQRYTQPWASEITKVTCPIQIWHGRADTWAPHAMSEALERSFQAPCELISCEGLGHYATLHHAMREIFGKPSSG